MTPALRIYQPPKNAMQSGRANTRQWVLEFAPGSPYFIEGLMGWTGMRDMTREVRLTFPTREAAVAYAQAHNLPYEVITPPPRKLKLKAYADNFKYNKVS